MTTYSEKLRDPRWQKQRLKILERDDWACQACFDSESTLHVHHRYYTKGSEPWEYSDEALLTLCEECHKFETDTRRVEEDQLLLVLRHYLLASDVDGLAEYLLCGFRHKVHLPMVVVDALGFMLRDRDALAAFVEEYFKKLAKVS